MTHRGGNVGWCTIVKNKWWWRTVDETKKWVRAGREAGGAAVHGCDKRAKRTKTRAPNKVCKTVF